VYGAEGCDELTFLDISASSDDRETTLDVVRRTAEQVFIPLTVGGGIRSVSDVDRLLRAGADKVSINTAAITRPELIAEIADRFGSQVLVLSVDARRARTESGFEVTTHGGRTGTGIDALEWTARACALGAGEVLLNSMDADGTRAGYDIGMITAVRAVTNVPLIASGGAGGLEDFVAAMDADGTRAGYDIGMITAVRAVTNVPLIASGGAGGLEDFAAAIDAGANALLAASVFHFGIHRIADVKRYLSSRGYPIREGAAH